VLTRNYGGDYLVETWEGGPNGDSWFIEEMRTTASTFSIVINLLGFILLAVASIGILSIMLLEVLGRSREIAVERALGASKFGIVKEFATRSLIVPQLHHSRWHIATA
jgi:ABC-type antimicrobial peptide transport system permease subunit